MLIMNLFYSFFSNYIISQDFKYFIYKFIITYLKDNY